MASVRRTLAPSLAAAGDPAGVRGSKVDASAGVSRVEAQRLPRLRVGA